MAMPRSAALLCLLAVLCSELSEAVKLRLQVRNDTANATNGTAGNATAPFDGTKVLKGHLPGQGYNEYGGKGLHKNLETHTRDWLAERPRELPTTRQETLKACKDTPDTYFCKAYLKKYGL
eukprot:TRINITY_DN5807_c0_g1_i1.p1 TRINITY_DN5807_c0_g1~~TRINITY_DN5807_c0_g1_i1.p1  ORF type:complete len:121 (+),score=35.96 TRINITY_DN5807_c0_g1_i1:53-415(+)